MRSLWCEFLGLHGSRIQLQTLSRGHSGGLREDRRYQIRGGGTYFRLSPFLFPISLAGGAFLVIPPALLRGPLAWATSSSPLSSSLLLSSPLSSSSFSSSVLSGVTSFAVALAELRLGGGRPREVGALDLVAGIVGLDVGGDVAVTGHS